MFFHTLNNISILAILHYITLFTKTLTNFSDYNRCSVPSALCSSSNRSFFHCVVYGMVTLQVQKLTNHQKEKTNKNQTIKFNIPQTNDKQRKKNILKTNPTIPSRGIITTSSLLFYPNELLEIY